ncbi:MAG: alkaline phosphatase family protein [Myxococcales bacterium]|nr:alkaline phosphatase family protein [Myxococcales bacterium]
MRAIEATRVARTRSVVAAALVLLVLGSIGAVQAGRSGASFMSDLEIVQPPLARIEPAIQDARTPRLARRVYLVIIDGLRSDRSYELPFLDSLRRAGLDLEAQSHYPTWSRPNYVSILAGVPPAASGVRTNHHNTPVTLDTLMDRAHAAHLEVATATDYAVLPQLFLRPASTATTAVRAIAPEALEEIDIDTMQEPLAKAIVDAPDTALVSPFDDARYVPWPGGFSAAGIALVAGGKADLVVLLVSSVDIAGHQSGADSVAYREAAESADRALARVLGRVDLGQDAIVVVADHGHTGKGGHGGVEPEVLTVPLILAGAGIDRAGGVDDARLIDVAPTVAALLGISAPGHGLGKTLTHVLALDPAARGRLEAADAARLVTTERVVAVADARASEELLEHRALRLAIVGLCVVLAGVLAWVMVRRGALRFHLRVLLTAVPAFFVVYYGLIGTFGQRFSPSLVPAQGHLAAQMAKYGLVGMAVQVAASLWALRNQGSLARRLAAANGIAWTGLVLAMLPAGLLWAFFPAPYLAVPGPVWLVVIPAVEVAVACAAITIALTLALEVIVFAARAWHQEHPQPPQAPPPA